MRAWQATFGRRSRQGQAGWVLLAIGMACAAWGARVYLQASAQQQAAQEARARSAEAAQRHQADLRRATAQESSPAYLQDPRWHPAAKALAAPWLTTLALLEQATKPPIFLTALRSDPSAGRVQIDAEAPDLQAALAYVQMLHKATPLRQVWLLQHEEVPDTGHAGRQILRFSVQATWGAGQ